MEEYGWLIERTKLPEESGVTWLMIDYTGDIGFTDKSHLAMRFAMKESADDFIAMLHRHEELARHTDGLVSTDHMWSDGDM